MAVKVARGQVTIIDQNDAVTLQAFIGSSQPLTQVYNKDTNAYAACAAHDLHRIWLFEGVLEKG